MIFKSGDLVKNFLVIKSGLVKVIFNKMCLKF